MCSSNVTTVWPSSVLLHWGKGWYVYFCCKITQYLLNFAQTEHLTCPNVMYHKNDEQQWKHSAVCCMRSKKEKFSWFMFISNRIWLTTIQLHGLTCVLLASIRQCLALRCESRAVNICCITLYNTYSMYSMHEFTRTSSKPHQHQAAGGWCTLLYPQQTGGSGTLH